MWVLGVGSRQKRDEGKEKSAESSVLHELSLASKLVKQDVGANCMFALPQNGILKSSKEIIMSNTAIITGASRGLGLELARALAKRDWKLIITARGASELERTRAELEAFSEIIAIPGDVSDEEHVKALIEAARSFGGLTALVNNASMLGPSSGKAQADWQAQPRLEAYPLDVLEQVYRVNVFAPLRLMQLALPILESHARVVNITSDAAVEAYAGWGGYGSSKAALEHLTKIFAVEHPELRVYWVDPGDMNTQMHQEAFPGEDISDRPNPDVSVPALLELLERDLPSGRYKAQHMNQVTT
jgi:NAD(P)-dependent dehydrogenase (short-subunit alcohol dehydrogenase family)